MIAVHMNVFTFIATLFFGDIFMLEFLLRCWPRVKTFLFWWGINQVSLYNWYTFMYSWQYQALL